MDILSTFGNNVRKFRTERHLSQEAFAEKCGLHRTYISAVERHKRSISLNNIQKIADALDIDTYQLFVERHPSLKTRTQHYLHRPMC
ncbi:MAG: helix-turn-helix domain-containing protein [Eggerthellaceae bacterium]|jgi:transcriptional regulator with XRE-family HTH domain|nr:helix-turn-helix domain-containing protein [Eggerthellaceae bacterium]MCH4220817.1 helix-turn-helix domain-containing protein [Eggerthellaceae bacterium]